MGGDRQQWRVPTGNATADGLTGRCERDRVGIVVGTVRDFSFITFLIFLNLQTLFQTDDDIVRHQKHPRFVRLEGRSENDLR